MSGPSDKGTPDHVLNTAVDITLRLALVALLIGLCFFIVRPFLILTLWATILAVSLTAPFERLVRLVGRRGWAATLMSLAATALIAAPLYLTSTSLVGSLRGLRAGLESGAIEAPPPPERLRELPVVGERAFAAWDLAHDDLQQAFVQFQPQIREAAQWGVGFLTRMGGAVLVTLVALIVASVLLAYRVEVLGGINALAERISPRQGRSMVQIAAATIRSVMLGVLGVAAIQALVSAALFVPVGVPAAGLLCLVIFAFAVVQLPALIIMIVPILWAAGNLSGIARIAVIAGAVVIAVGDAPLKAMLLGRGLEIPTLVVLIGAIGGLATMGLIGLFIGAVALCIGYRILELWMGIGPSLEVLAERAADTQADVAPA